MINDQIQQIEELMRKKEYQNALDLLNSTKKDPELDSNSKLYLMYLECLLLGFLGKYAEVKTLVKQLWAESKKTGMFLLEIDAISMILRTHTLPEEESILKECIQRSEELLKTHYNESNEEFLIREAIFYYSLGDYYYHFHGDQFQSFEYYTLASSKMQNLSRSFLMLEFIYYRSFYDLGYYHLHQGQLNKALELFQEGLEKATSWGDKKIIRMYLESIGFIFAQKGEYQTALQYYEKTLSLSKESGDLIQEIRSLIHIGVMSDRQGNFDKALAFFQQAIDVGKSKKDFEGYIGISYNNIGRIHALRGNMDQAFEFILNGMKLLQKVNYKKNLLETYFTFGELLAEIGNIEESLEHLTKGLEAAKKLGYKRLQSRFLYGLIRVLIENNQEGAKSLLNELKEIYESSDCTHISQHYRLAEAWIGKVSDRLSDKIKALSIFTSITEEPIVRIEQTADAICNICDLLLYEYKISGNKEVLMEVKSWLNKLVNIAESQHNYIILSETYLVQSMVALMELEPATAQELQEKALTIAKERKIYRLTRKISAEKQKLTENLSKWKVYSTQQISIGEIFELTQIDNIISQMLSKRLNIKEDYKLKTHYAQLAKSLFEELENSGFFEKA